jgi:hypothetical protein
LKRRDFVYTLDRRTGLPFTAINANPFFSSRPSESQEQDLRRREVHGEHSRTLDCPLNLNEWEISNALIDWGAGAEASGLWEDDGQSAPYCLLLRLESPCRRGPLDLAIETAFIQVGRLDCTGRQDFIVSVAG